MFPLHDDNPTRIFPVVTVALIVICTLVFLWELAAPNAEGVAYSFGLIPAVFFGARELPPELSVIPSSLTLITSMFLHGGWMHLIGNMAYLWIFGNNVEDAMGHARFIIFYLLCGVAATLAHAFFDIDSTLPLVGASGAIAGVLGAYLLLHPKSRVLVLVFLGFFVTTVRLPAVVVIGFWIALQLFNAALAGPSAGGVAWWAHIGGFVAGLALIPFFRHADVPFFDRKRRRRPWG